MSFFDVILTVVYFVICLVIGNNIKKRNWQNPLYKKWFVKGLAIKLFGGLAFALVYTYYYEYGGDTRSYFRDSQLLASSILDGWETYWDVFYRRLINADTDAMNYTLRMAYKDPREYFVVNFVSIFTILGLGSYFSATLLVALFTYWGVWKFFLLMVGKFPKLEKQMAFAILFIPSVVFWGSGISKDSFIFCAVGLVLYHVNEIMSGKFWQIKSLLVIAVASYFYVCS